jgi:hypothetical protein
MKKTNANTLLQNGTARVGMVTAAILSIPLIGRWPWGIFDFVIMGALIFGTGMMLDYVIRTVDKKYRVPAIFAVLGVFFLIWTQMAVGLVSQILTGELWIFEYLR